MLKNAKIVVLVLALAAVVTGPAGAEPGDGRLTGRGDQERWEAVASYTGVLSQHRLTVDLPANVWTKPGGVQIGIRWEREDDDLELRVTGPDGVVYASEGIVSTAESVLIPRAADGEYAVSVYSASNPDVAYEAFAEVEHTPRAQPARALLPDLTSRPARNLNFALGAYLVAPAGPVGPASCYPEETVEREARTCLRFDQIIANDGEGPFELRYRMPPEQARPGGDNVVMFEKLFQRIYHSDGSAPTDRYAAPYEFHPAHAHFHYREFARSSLWAADAQGRKLAATPAAQGDKIGFCMVDVENHRFAEAGDAARTYRPPACLAPTEGDENVNGISPGWSDVYNWYLADQFIEVSDLEDGYYVLETVADPDNTILEADEANNCAAVLIRLRDGVTAADLLGPVASC